jgi:hypothetical protein
LLGTTAAFSGHIVPLSHNHVRGASSRCRSRARSDSGRNEMAYRSTIPDARLSRLSHRPVTARNAINILKSSGHRGSRDIRMALAETARRSADAVRQSLRLGCQKSDCAGFGVLSFIAGFSKVFIKRLNLECRVAKPRRFLGFSECCSRTFRLMSESERTVEMTSDGQLSSNGDFPLHAVSAR